MDLKSVHIGQAIEKRRRELKITKTEFAQRIGVPPQHINRIIARETMDTARLMAISQALDYNFFSLFCPMPHQISAYLAAVAVDGKATNMVGDPLLTAELSKLESALENAKKEVAQKEEIIQYYKDREKDYEVQIKRFEANLKDKDAIIESKNTIIELLKERRQ